MKQRTVFFTVISLLMVVLVLLNLFIGAVHIPAGDVWAILCGKTDPTDPWHYIVWESRIPQAFTALLAGAGLAVSGLMLQTAFHNPLAGPSILGITAGANLGVALVMLALGGVVSAGGFALSGYLAVVLAAFAGSILVIGALLALSTLLKNNLMLLITGILLSYLTSSVISLLNSLANEQSIQSYTLWGLGDFSSVSNAQMPLFAGLSLIGILIALTLIKPLNAVQLGENYASNLGISVQHLRNRLLLATGMICAVVTAFCGPISFLGLAVPHVARLLTRTDNQQVLMPATLLIGADMALLCNLICVLPENTLIPLNAVTPLLGAPVILYVILRRR